MNSIHNEIRQGFPKLLTNVALALTFAVIGTVASPALNSFSAGGGFLAWVALMLVAGIFLVRALFEVLVISDKTVGLVLRRVGIRDDSSRKRVFKDLAYIVATILAAAAINPLIVDIADAGTQLQAGLTYVALGIILLFMYDIGRTVYHLAEEKANSVADWLVQKSNGEAK